MSAIIRCPASSLCEWRARAEASGSVTYPLSQLRSHLIDRHDFPPLRATSKAIDVMREVMWS